MKKVNTQITKRMRANIMRIYILFALAVLVFGLAPLGASALTVSPPLMEFDARAGDSIVDVVKLYNETSEPVTLISSVQNFQAMGEGGSPEFLPTEAGGGLASWITLDQKEITLSPGERQSVLFTIGVPTDAEPGGHFAGILWSTGAAAVGEAPGAAVSLVAKTGTLVLVRIAGEINEMGRIVEFSTDKPSYNYLPTNFMVRFENTGNVHLKPVGTIEVKNMWGAKVASLMINEGLTNVLPNSIRRFGATWQNKETRAGASEWQKERENFAWGKYTAIATLNYGVGGQTAVAKTTYWVFPWRVTLFYFVLAVMVLLLLVQGVKKYNRWLLRKYGGKVA